jgi:uncharacterized protein (DUF427 family)
MTAVESESHLDKDVVKRSEIRLEPWPRWVRGEVGGVTAVDSKRVQLLLEPKRLPVYYVPSEDVRMDLLERGDVSDEPTARGPKTLWHLTVGDRRVENAAWTHDEPPPGLEALRDLIAFRWDAMDHWFEEDDEVFVHARDPYHRVDVLRSSRHVRVELHGVTVAETSRPRLLFETNLPTRYYIPRMDVRMEVFTPTDTRTRCPYKGEAVYWTADVDGERFDDVAWSYPTPIPECPKIEGLVAFYNERADIYVDGELQERPSNTPWSPRR